MRTFAQKQNQPQKPVSSSLARPNLATLGPTHREHPILHLQRAIGNQTLQRMLQTHAEEPDVGWTAAASPRFGHDFSQIPIHPPTAGAIQTKLAINKPGDEYEQEADRIAEQVMRTPNPQLRTEQPGREHESLQTKRVQASDTRQVAAPPIVHEVLHSPGRLLDPATRNFMEPRFERDFGGVRVHTDPQAGRSAQAVQAQAYTVGRDIVFGAGQYSPATSGGQSLLAHELAHTLQSATSSPTLRRKPDDGKATKPSKSEPPDKKADTVVEIQLSPWVNKAWFTTSELLLDRELSPLLFKDGKVPPGFTLAAVTDSLVTNKWVLTGPEGQDISSVSSPFNERFANQLADERARQQALEQKQSAVMNDASVREARARFRARHDGHSVKVLDNIDAALIRVTRNNPNLLIAYYDYYADAKLTDEIEKKKDTGATASGDTDINPRVLGLDSVFPTSDPYSLLGGTLIHEYVHTPQGPRGYPHEQVPKEAKAYGVELVLAEHMGDKKRVDFINARYTNDIMDQKFGGDKIFLARQNTMRALYKVIDSGRTEIDARIAGDISAEEARRMSVEFISRNEEDYGTRLKDFISKHSP
ncbi:MAG: DUF4157 domain-containing protein [Acidobacteriota bacterium]